MGAIGLDYVALQTVADITDTDLTPALLGKIQALEHHELKRMAS